MNLIDKLSERIIKRIRDDEGLTENQASLVRDEVEAAAVEGWVLEWDNNPTGAKLFSTTPGRQGREVTNKPALLIVEEGNKTYANK